MTMMIFAAAWDGGPAIKEMGQVLWAIINVAENMAVGDSVQPRTFVTAGLQSARAVTSKSLLGHPGHQLPGLCQQLSFALHGWSKTFGQNPDGEGITGSIAPDCVVLKRLPAKGCRFCKKGGRFAHAGLAC